MSSAPSHDPDAAYLALCARDARFDGRLFVGVTSTGVYCRPVCRVRTPRRENCRFFDTRAQAEAAAFRPCLKCRPEIAPGLSQMDSSRSLADSAARAIEQAVHGGHALGLPALAERLGVTDRHLRRIFQAAHGVAPHDYLTTQRLLLAKQLLTDTAQPVTQVALASGFESLRRFNAAFHERYRLNPTQLRRERTAPTAAARRLAAAGDGELRLAYRPPYDIAGMLGHIQRRALPGMEMVDGLTLRRTLAWQQGSEPVHGWLSARFAPDRCELHLAVSDSLVPMLGALLQRVRHALDLDAEPALTDPVLALLPLPARPGLRLPGAFDGFESAVRVVLGQQVTVAAARTLVRRVAERYGTAIVTPFPELQRVFPDAATIAAADPEVLGRLGIVRQRVRALQALATEVAGGRLLLQPGAPLLPTLAALKALPGIGDWTAQVIAMRALAWPDAWPASDIGLLNALAPHVQALAQAQGAVPERASRTRDALRITQLAEAWRPWRAYAVMRLWHFIETSE
jgi:AraC family transcriptional regulator of adaptative response / DNA-3-methyladenine glycosylase II